MELKYIKTNNAPNPVGPYSQAVVFNNLLFTSGQLGINPETSILADGIENQAHQLLKNLEAVAMASGTSLNKAVKIITFLNNLNAKAVVDEIYKQYFGENIPAHSVVKVTKLPLNALIEVEAIIPIV